MKKLLSVSISILMSIFIIVCAAFPAAASVASNTRDSVVVVSAVFEADDGGYFQFGYGTGFFISAEGEAPQNLITNHHVIKAFELCGSGDRCTIDFGEALKELEYDEYYYKELLGVYITGRAQIRIFYDENTYEEGYIVESDELYDFAILRLASPTNKRSSLPLTKPDDSMVGEEVLAVGFPGLADNVSLKSTEKWNLTSATVNGGTFSKLYIESGKGRELIDNDCNTKGGNSGGPLVLKETGGVVGLNTYAIHGTNSDSIHTAVSIGNVLPILDRNNIKYTLIDGSENTSGAITNTDSNNTVTEATNEVNNEATNEVTATESEKKNNSSNMGIIILVIVFAVIIVGGIAAVIVFMNKNKKASETAVAEAKAAAAAASVKPVKTPYIRSLAAQHGGTRIKMTNEEILIGRDSNCKIAFKESTPGVSGTHCSISYNSNTNDFILKDLKSTYGTFLQDGTKLTPNTPYRLRSGDRFYLGDKSNILCVELE